MALNPSKTHVMLFSKKGTLSPKLTMQGSELKFVKEHRHLGLLLSSAGNWNE